MKNIKRFIDDHRYEIMTGLAVSTVTMTLATIATVSKYGTLMDVKDNYRDGMNLLGNFIIENSDVDADGITTMLKTVSPDFYRAT